MKRISIILMAALVFSFINTTSGQLTGNAVHWNNRAVLPEYVPDYNQPISFNNSYTSYYSDQGVSNSNQLNNFLRESAPVLATGSVTGTSSSDWRTDMKPDLRTRTYISAGLFIPALVTGYLMRGSNGDPDGLLLGVHKLTTVSNLVLLDATVLRKNRSASLSWLETFTAITMNVCFVSTITTGGLQSVGKPMPGWVNTVHGITPWITMISSGVLLYLLNN